MKYIIWPIVAIFCAMSLVAVGTARLFLLSLWNLRIPSLREAYTIDGEYLFEDWSWSSFLKDIFLYPQKQDDEEDNIP